MKPIHFLYLFLISGLLISVSCSEDDNDDNGPKDVTPPEITIYGDKTIEIPLHGDWREEVPQQQAKAEDDNDGVVDYDITSNVDSTKAGEYEVTYTAADNAGNEASASRTVIVRIEGANLEGVWEVRGNAGGSTINFIDTIAEGQQSEFYFQRFSDYVNARVRAELSGKLGDSVTIPEQTLPCGDPPKDRIFSGSGIVIHDGKSMEISFSETTEGETVEGEIDYYLEDK
ncbi:MAG: DUF5011 domain-containing protein [Bacteroidales bacterium]|nr:DUF5011 domain-containing protein [Bacteroidales bacterium]